MNKNEVLKNVFGYDEFREGQAQLVDALLQAETRLVSCLLALVNQSAIRYRL